MKVTLAGGMAHGRVIDTFFSKPPLHIRVQTDDEMGPNNWDAIDVYVGRRYASNWPFPEWDFIWIDQWEPYEYAKFHWETRIWATEGRHKLIDAFMRDFLSPEILEIHVAYAAHDEQKVWFHMGRFEVLLEEFMRLIGRSK